MNTEVLGVIAQIVLLIVLSYPLGKYIAKVYKGEKTWSDFMKPVERVMFKLSGINPNEEMNWKQFLRALLVVNLFWFLWGMVLLVTQGVLPLNPDGNVGQTAHQAFNTCISFMVNCNLQHYSGESGLTYFTQLFVIMLFQFITAATGMDALTHAIEGLITKGAWEMSDMFEIKAIEMIARYLETAVFEPTNAEARNGMAVAQYIAGMAFSNVGLGVVHGMAHPLGAIFDIPHGVANALLLPVIMEFNAPAALSKYVDIAKAMNVYKDGMSQEEAAKAAVEAVKALSVKVGIPQHLSELGIKEEDLPRLAASAIADVCTPGNPREVTEEIILELYKKAF